MPYREIFSKSRRLEDGLLCLNPVLSKFWERYAGFPWDLLGVQATPHKQSYTKSRFVPRNQRWYEMRRAGEGDRVFGEFANALVRN
ncbi:MAG: hypothetical protein QF745_05770, partial [Planctomycetota bacterium]|nr:hypothetical protein [Planctomycetota bacterium]